MTRIIETIEEMREWSASLRAEGKTIGYVPTMGYLHEGHLALVAEAHRVSDVVVMSIFVNPTQFGPNEDFDSYPRDLPRDAALAADAGVDCIFAPSTEEMYPTDGGIRIVPGPIAQQMCGASRPTHFDGVLQVLLKLFNIVSPTDAFFGLKDAQQVAVVETFVRDFNVPVRIHRVPIVRERDGLAKSSRNVHLTEQERKEAPAIYRALQAGKEAFETGMSPHEVKRQVATEIERDTSGTIDYVELLDYPSLGEPTEDRERILACAVQFPTVRLIDNVIIKGSEQR